MLDPNHFLRSYLSISLAGRPPELGITDAVVLPSPSLSQADILFLIPK